MPGELHADFQFVFEMLCDVLENFMHVVYLHVECSALGCGVVLCPSAHL